MRFSPKNQTKTTTKTPKTHQKNPEKNPTLPPQKKGQHPGPGRCPAAHPPPPPPPGRVGSGRVVPCCPPPTHQRRAEVPQGAGCRGGGAGCLPGCALRPIPPPEQPPARRAAPAPAPPRPAPMMSSRGAAPPAEPGAGAGAGARTPGSAPRGGWRAALCREGRRPFAWKHRRGKHGSGVVVRAFHARGFAPRPHPGSAYPRERALEIPLLEVEKRCAESPGEDGRVSFSWREKKNRSGGLRCPLALRELRSNGISQPLGQGGRELGGGRRGRPAPRQHAAPPLRLQVV